MKGKRRESKTLIIGTSSIFEELTLGATASIMTFHAKNGKHSIYLGVKFQFPSARLKLGENTYLDVTEV